MDLHSEKLKNSQESPKIKHLARETYSDEEFVFSSDDEEGDKDKDKRNQGASNKREALDDQAQAEKMKKQKLDELLEKVRKEWRKPLEEESPVVVAEPPLIILD